MVTYIHMQQDYILYIDLNKLHKNVCLAYIRVKGITIKEERFKKNQILILENQFFNNDNIDFVDKLLQVCTNQLIYI